MNSELALRQRALDGSSSDEYTPSSPNSFWGDPSPEASESRDLDAQSGAVTVETHTSGNQDEKTSCGNSQTVARAEDEEVFDVRTLLLERHQQRRKPQRQRHAVERSSKNEGSTTVVRLPSVEEALESGAERAQQQRRRQEEAAAQSKISLLGTEEVHHVSAGSKTGESNRQKRKQDNGKGCHRRTSVICESDARCEAGCYGSGCSRVCIPLLQSMSVCLLGLAGTFHLLE